MGLTFLTVFVVSFILSLFFTICISKLATHLNIVDDPTKASRKIHQIPTPLLGGIAIWGAFVIVILSFFLFTSQFETGHILQKHVIGVLIGSLFLMVGGWMDDRYQLKSYEQLFFSLSAVFVIILFGIGIDYVTNPFGGLIYLDTYKTSFLWFFPFTITWLSDIFAFFWLLGIMYTIKLLDGLDGLATGISLVGFLVIFLLSVAQGVSQYSESILSLSLVGACLGFLMFNFHPAKIFLGEGGSTFLGFMLGVLAIISGGKIATTLLILGIPILDVCWVILRRIFVEKTSPFRGDRKHLHHRLLDTGLRYRQVVLTYYFLAFLFGITTIFLQSTYKLVALLLLTIVMIILGGCSIWIYHKKKQLVR